MLDPKKEKAVEEHKKWISLTGLCNNNCIFCLDGERTDRFHKSRKEIKKKIDKGIEEGASRLVLSGGEPTIHPDLLEFIRYGKKKGYKRIQIISNGRMLAYPSFIQALKKAGLDEVTFSLHGTREIHDAMTRIPGSFAQITAGIRNAKKEGFIVNTDTTMTKINYKHLHEIISYIYSLGIDEVNLMSIVPFGNAWKNREQVVYGFEDVVPYVEKVIKFCRKNNITLWFSRFPAEYLENYPEYIESPKKIFEEVLARGEDFFKKTPSCFGERCRYCGVYPVCGNLVNKRYYDSEPPCFFFPDAGESLKGDGFKYVKGTFKEAAAEICMNARTKKLSCSRCICNDSCHGILIEDARKGGFSSLKPIMQREIRINLSCNQDCSFCNTDKNADNFILDDSEIKKKIRRWAEEGVNSLVITGKEPTLHRKIADFIKTARQSKYKKIELQTNAVLFSDRGFAKRLAKEGLTHAFVSFHSSDKEQYEKITNSKTFEKAVNGIKNLSAEGINVTLNIVVNQLNYKTLPASISYISRNFPNVKMVIISFVAPVCNALGNKWIIPKITDAVPYIKQAINKGSKSGIVCRIPSRCGIPVCFLPDYKQHFDEIKEGSRWRNQEGKIKIEKCKSCRFNNSCSGLWKEYFKIYGFS